MTRLLASILFLSLGMVARAGEPFPVLEAEKLDEAKVEFPKEFQESGALLIVGFTKASQASTTICGDLIEKELPGKAWSMAVLEGIPFFVKGSVKKAIRNAIPMNRKDRYLFLYDGKKVLKLAVKFDEKFEDDAYVIGISKKVQGSDSRDISFVTHGVCGEEQMKKIKAGLGPS